MLSTEPPQYMTGRAGKCWLQPELPMNTALPVHHAGAGEQESYYLHERTRAGNLPRRALGNPQFKLGKEKNPVDCTPEVCSMELNSGDNAIVLATDGLWDVLSDVAVVQLLGEVPFAAFKVLHTGACLA